jgi:hypothetical protein
VADNTLVDLCSFILGNWKSNEEKDKTKI